MNTTVINLLISIPAIIIFIFAVLLGTFRKTVKAAVKLITVLLAFFISIPISSAVSKAVAEPVGELIFSLLAQAGVTEETLAAMPTLEALPEALAYSLATPFIFTVCFILLSLFLLIAYAILKRALKSLCEKQTGAQHRVFGALVGAVVALVLVVGVYTPVVGLVDTVASLDVTEADLEGIGGADAILTAKEYVDDVDASPLFIGTQTLGGNWLYSTLSKAELNGETIVLKDELSHLLDAALSATAFKGAKVETLGDAEAEALYKIESAAAKSDILMGILPEALSGASNAWLEGKAFLGMQKPAVNEMVSGAFDALLKIFSTSSRENIEDDLHTLVSLADAVIDSGMLAKIGNTEGLMLVMQQDGVISSIAAPLYDNPRMTVLVPEIINIGLRAAVEVMNIPETKEELYSEFTSDVAAELNAMSELSLSEMIDALTGKMDKICANYALDISDTEKYCLAVGIAYEFNGRSDITEGEVADFLAEYAAYSENEGEEIVTKVVRAEPLMFVSYTENQSDSAKEELLITFKNSDNVGEFVTIDATRGSDGALTVKKDASKKSGAAYAAALMKLLREQANAGADEGKAEEARIKVMELTLDMAGSAEDSERISQSLNAKVEKDIERGIQIEPKLASKPENFPTEIPVITDLLFTDDFAPIVDDKDDKDKDKDKDKEQQKAANEAAAKAVEKIAKAVSTLSTVLVNNTNITENMAVIMQQTGAILDGITEISQNGQEKASLLTKSILSSDLVSDRVPISKDKLIGMAETISNEVIKAKEEAEKQQEQKPENDKNPDDNGEAPENDAPEFTEAPTTTAAPVTAAPVTTAPVTEAPVTTEAITTAPVTTAPITTEVPETEAPGYENFFGATGEMLVNIMILTGGASSEEKFEAIEAMMDNITPTAAKALLYVCSAELLMEYGIEEEYAEGLAQGLSVLFSSLSEEVKPEDRTAVRSLFSLVFINKGASHWFAGDGDSTLDISAYAFVKTVISSRAVCNAVKYISIDLSEKTSDFDRASLKIAFEKNYEQATKNYQKDAIDNLSDIFGVDYDVNQFDW